MSARDAIRHLLKQALAETERYLNVAAVETGDRDAVRSFQADLQKLITRLENTHLHVVDDAEVGREVFALYRHCNGPLERFRGFLQDALACIETVV